MSTTFPPDADTCVSNPPVTVAADTASVDLDQAVPLDPQSFPNPPHNGSSYPPATIPNACVSDSPATVTVDVPRVDLEKAEPLDLKSFPNPPRNGSSYPPATIPNIQHLIKSYGIDVKSNVITKRLEITVPGRSGGMDTGEGPAITQIISLATLNGIAHGQVWSYIETIANSCPYNPVEEWIRSEPWDGTDRLPAIYQTLVTAEGFSEALKETLVRKWLLSAVAAALKPVGFSGRGVLTFQGPQSIGKTSWLKSLVPDTKLRQKVVKVDHHLDPNNKDSILGAVVHWLVEIGELDSSFRKDVARLKGFLTSDSDKVRRPYGRTESVYPRNTVFFATVNENHFLVDSTGNSRWWTIPLIRIDYTHTVDTQQLFAQLADDFDQGAQWWLTGAEESDLEESNKDHRAQSLIRELIMKTLDLERKPDVSVDAAMTASELLKHMGIERPHNTQCKECSSILRELLGQSKKIRGSQKWRIPLAGDVLSTLKTSHIDPNGEY